MDYSVFEEAAQTALAEAVMEAATLGAQAVRPEHVRLAVMRLEYERLRDELREGESADGKIRIPVDPSLIRLLEAAATSATEENPFTRRALGAMVERPASP